MSAMDTTPDTEIETGLRDWGGRPRKFQSMEQVQALIDEWFKSLEGYWDEVTDYVAKKGRSGKEIIRNGAVQYDEVKRKRWVEPKAPTVVGLARTLSTTRDTLLAYEERGLGADATDFERQFLDTIKAAKLTVEEFNAQNLAGGKVQAAGVIFTMINNHGWKQASEIKTSGEQTVKLERTPTDAELSDLVARTVASGRPGDEGEASPGTDSQKP